MGYISDIKINEVKELLSKSIKNLLEILEQESKNSDYEKDYLEEIESLTLELIKRKRKL
mgnify:CR=1 FL=1